MLRTPREDTYTFTINVRPIKFAYFIRDDDDVSLARVMRLVCTQWGGIHNVIVPVSEETGVDQLWLEFVRDHDPDQFISYVSREPNYAAENKLQEQLGDLFPNRTVSVTYGPAWEQRDHSAHALSVSTEDAGEPTAGTDPVQGLIEHPKLVQYDLVGTSLPGWVRLALYGEIYPGQESDYQRYFWLPEVAIHPGGEEFWHSQFNNEPLSSTVNLTSYGIRPTRVVGGWTDPVHFDVVLVDSVPSACLYWNLRGLRDSIQFDKGMGRRTLLLPSALVDEDHVRTLTGFIRQHVLLPNRSTNLHMNCYTTDGQRSDLLRHALSRLEGVAEFREASVSEKWHLGSPVGPSRPLPPDQPLTFQCLEIDDYGVLDTFAAFFQEGVPGSIPQRINLSVGRNEVLFEPPVNFRNRFGGAVAVDYECEVWNRYPSSVRVAEAISPNTCFSHRGLTGLFGLLARPTYLTFNVPDEWDSLSTYFGGKGYEIRQSKDGQYADAVASLVGGFSDVGVLKSKEAYLLVDMLSLRSSKKVAQRIVSLAGLRTEQLADVERAVREVVINPELSGIPKTFSQLRSDARLGKLRDRGLLDLLSALTEAQIIKRGFYLPCPHCGSSDWYPLADVHEYLTCSGCSAPFMLPVKDPKGREIHWQYRLNTLVNRAMDQDVLPNLLALYHVTRDRQTACMTTGLELVRDGDAANEFDFLFVSEQSLYAGECKAASAFTEKDLGKVRLAAGLGFRGFYLCTAGNFPSDMQERVAKLRRELDEENLRIEIELVAGGELLGESV